MIFKNDYTGRDQWEYFNFSDINSGSDTWELQIGICKKLFERGCSNEGFLTVDIKLHITMT